MGANPKQEQALAPQAPCSLKAQCCLQFCAELNNVPSRDPLTLPACGKPGWEKDGAALAITQSRAPQGQLALEWAEQGACN